MEIKTDIQTDIQGVETRGITTLAGEPIPDFFAPNTEDIPTAIKRLEKEIARVRKMVIMPDTFFRVFPASSANGNFNELVCNNGVLSPFLNGRTSTHGTTGTATPIALLAGQTMLLEMDDYPNKRYVQFPSGGTSSTSSATVNVMTSLTVGTGAIATENFQQLTVLAAGATSSTNITLPSGTCQLLFAKTDGALVEDKVIGSGSFATTYTMPPEVSINFVPGASYRVHLSGTLSAGTTSESTYELLLLLYDSGSGYAGVRGTLRTPNPNSEGLNMWAMDAVFTVNDIGDSIAFGAKAIFTFDEIEQNSPYGYLAGSSRAMTIAPSGSGPGIYPIVEQPDDWETSLESMTIEYLGKVPT